MPVFHDDDDREAFLERVGGLVGDGVLVVHAFCLMPNHYHLLCETPRGGLGRIVRHVNGDYATTFNTRHRRVGHLWQGRYKAILVEEGRYLLECSRYIHLNPNRSRLTRPAERYRWSSYRNYVGVPPRVPWVSTGRILDELGGDRNGYRRYVESGKGEKAVSPFERAVAGLVLGSAAFVSKVKERLVERSSSPEEPSLRHLARHGVPPPEDVEAAVAEVFKAEAPCRRRRLVYYALRRFSSIGVSAIARRCGRTSAAVTIATRQLGEEAGRNPALSTGMQRIAMILIEARR
jgi:hypothetical protein